MAKKPTPTTASAPAADAPSQPWGKTPAAPADSATVTGDTSNAPAGATTTQIPQAQPAPATGTAAEEQSQAHANVDAAKHDGGELGAAATAPEPKNTNSDKDLAGEDAGTNADEKKHEKLRQTLDSLDEEERAEFEEHMTREAEKALQRIARRRQAREFEVNLVDPDSHYGNKIVPNNAPDPVATEDDDDA